MEKFLNETENSKILRTGLWAQPQYQAKCKEIIRAQLPKLTVFDLMRRKRSATILVQSLYQQGLVKTAAFIEDMLKCEKDLQRGLGVANVLAENFPILQNIAAALEKIERGKEETIIELLQMTKDLSEKYPKNYECLIEKLFEKTGNVCRELCFDRHLEAVCMNELGKYRMEKCSMYEEAKSALEDALVIVKYNKTWTFTEDGITKSLYTEVNYLLHLVCLKMVNTKDYSTKEFVKSALDFAITSGRESAIVNAYIKRGDLEMEHDKTVLALTYYSKAVRTSKTSNSPKLLCEASLRRADILFRLGYTRRSERILELIHEIALRENLPQYRGAAYLLDAQLERKVKGVATAIPKYSIAFTFLVGMKSALESVQTARFQGAVALAQFLFDPYVKKVERAKIENSGLQNYPLKALSTWKFKRFPFWKFDKDTHQFEDREFFMDCDYKFQNFKYDMVFEETLENTMFPNVNHEKMDKGKKTMKLLPYLTSKFINYHNGNRM